MDIYIYKNIYVQEGVGVLFSIFASRLLLSFVQKTKNSQRRPREAHLVDALGVGTHGGDVLAQETEGLVTPLLVLNLQDLHILYKRKKRKTKTRKAKKKNARNDKPKIKIKGYNYM